MGPADLEQLLERLPVVDDPRVMVGHRGNDDAAVYLVRPDLAVVQSIDVFGPVVDDPWDYGQIAAANALSDLYAMGVEPAFALAFVGWPTGDLPDELLSEVMRGGAEKVIEAGAVLLGGHSIKDVEPKYGLVVTGFAPPEQVLTNAGAREGDVLVLTKPLGSGILAHAIKYQHIEPDAERRVIALMATLNRAAAAAAREVGVHAATDITGFGFLGHLGEVCRASGLAAEVDAGAVPTLPDARALVARGVIPGGSKKNLRYISKACAFDPAVTEAERLLLADAQTSGGLLLAVSPERADDLVAALKARGTPCAAVVGRLTARGDAAPLIRIRR